MRFMLKLLAIGILVFVSYYMFIAERSRGSLKSQVQQAFGVKDTEVEEMAAKFGLDLDTRQRQAAKMLLDQEKQEIAAVLKDKNLTKQQQSERIIKIHKTTAFWLMAYSKSSDKEKEKKIAEWLMSRESNASDVNSP